jgi:hypothetical protein
MILTEYGLQFRCEGDQWRCVDHTALLMLRGEPDWADSTHGEGH